ACNPTSAAIDAALGTATATDACGTPTVTSSDGAATTSGCTVTQISTFTAVDACANSATTSRTVTWTSDLTPPTITATGTTNTLRSNQRRVRIDAALGTATATDACGTPTVTSSDGAATTSGCTVTQIRTFTAVDACGNSTTTSKTVTWPTDLPPPTITATGTTNALACNPTSAAIDAALGTATATDACGTPTVTSSDGAATTSGCTVTQIRTFTAVDACEIGRATCREVMWTSDLTPSTITT